MSQLAKSHIDIIDESAYGAGTSNIVPLYVIATEENKVVDSKGTIALGTTKEVAKEVLIVTSRKDCVDKFGIAKATTIDGTTQQGDELNEVGLMGLYDTLGSASLAYALRADIDLKQLQPTKNEPKGKAKNATKWLDLLNTSYGLFRCNGNPRPTLAWDRIDYVLVPAKEQLDDNDKPLSGYGKNGDIAVVNTNAGNAFYENVNSEWFEIGTDAWKTALTTNVKLFYATHSQTPSTDLIAGSIWIKTTEPNYGSSYVMKTYNSTNDAWVSTKLSMFGSYLEAERVLGPSLKAGSMIVKYDGEHTPCIANNQIKEFAGKILTITATVKAPTFAVSDTFTVRTLEDGKYVSATISGFTSVAGLINKFNVSAVKKSLTASLTADGFFQITSLTGNAVELIDGTNNPITALGIARGEISQWIDTAYIAQAFEPSTDASEGTLWFNNDTLVDIMVNDNGKWSGYKNKYADATIYVQPAEPTTLVDYDLWVNTAYAEYPRIMRAFEGSWELIDNTDQTTGAGIIFADARENSGYTKNFSTKQEDLLVSDYVDPNTPNPQTYSDGILLFNTLYSTNNIKEFVNEYKTAVKDLGETYKVGNSIEFATPGSVANPKTTRWSTVSGNDFNGVGLFGKKAQRIMVVRAMAEAVNSNDDIRSFDYDFFFAVCPGYPELDDELISLNVDKKEMFYILGDTPSKLKPTGNAIQDWATNKNNAPSHGLEGRVLRNAYVTRQYPPMGIITNVDGSEVAVPTSIAKMKNLIVLPRGRFAAGVQYGQVKNLASVGYITDENEYASVVVRDGLGEIICGQSMNPIMPQRGTGLLFWGENTENPYTSSLSDEHAILTILRLKRQLDEACIPFYFQPNTESVRKDFDAVLRGIFNDFVGREELYDYTLVTDRSVNTNERIARKEMWANAAIEIVKGIEQIYIPIRVVNTGSLSSGG